MNALVPLPASRRAILGAVLATLAPLPALADPVYAAMARHRRAYDAMVAVWDTTESIVDLYARRDTDPNAAAQLRLIADAERAADEEAFSALLAVKPTTKAGAIACVQHVADCGLVTDQLGAWLLLMLESPLVLSKEART
jgi:hypothetical protein